jgi:prepilin-type N-terminal cleavage/methylation domain-containing protein
MALKHKSAQRGFTIVELLVVVAIIVIISVVAVPNVVSAVRNLRLNGAVGDYANLLQQARLRAVRDNRTYQVHTTTVNGQQYAYVDVYPQNADGSSGDGTMTVAAGQQDPSVAVNSEVTIVNNDPSLAALKTALGNTATIDAANNDPTFGPRGTPCTPSTSAGSPYCKNPGQPDQFITIFQSSTNQRLEGVTVDGAGRIQRWLYNSTANTWSTL